MGIVYLGSEAFSHFVGKSEAAECCSQGVTSQVIKAVMLASASSDLHCCPHTPSAAQVKLFCEAAQQIALGISLA